LHGDSNGTDASSNADPSDESAEEMPAPRDSGIDADRSDNASDAAPGAADAAIPSNLLLSLDFENGLQAGSGQSPIVNEKTVLVRGYYGTGAMFAEDARVEYAVAPGLSQEGSVVFWYRNSASPTDGVSRAFFFHGTSGVLIVKDANSHLRLIVNRESPPGYSERGVSYYVDDTTLAADEWHHLAASWDTDSVALYLDGELLGEAEVDVPLVSFEGPIGVGCDRGLGAGANGTLDSVRIYSVALTSDEIIEEFLASESSESDL